MVFTGAEWTLPVTVDNTVDKQLVLHVWDVPAPRSWQAIVYVLLAFAVLGGLVKLLFVVKCNAGGFTFSARGLPGRDGHRQATGER